MRYGLGRRHGGACRVECAAGANGVLRTQHWTVSDQRRSLGTLLVGGAGQDRHDSVLARRLVSAAVIRRNRRVVARDCLAWLGALGPRDSQSTALIFQRPSVSRNDRA